MFDGESITCVFTRIWTSWFFYRRENLKVSAEKRFTMQQHLSRDKHINGVELSTIQNEVQEKRIHKVLIQTYQTDENTF